MEITIAQQIDFPNIIQLIKDCIKDLKEHKIYQWGDFYPADDIIAADIHSKTMYLIKNNEECLAIIVLNEDQPPQYKDIQWLNDKGKILVIHRLIVHPKRQRQKIGTKLMDFAEDFAVRNNYTSIRLETYGKNLGSIMFYENRGYIRTGQAYFPNREHPFYCYEKLF